MVSLERLSTLTMKTVLTWRTVSIGPHILVPVEERDLYMWGWGFGGENWSWGFSVYCILTGCVNLKDGGDSVSLELTTWKITQSFPDCFGEIKLQVNAFFFTSVCISEVASQWTFRLLSKSFKKLFLSSSVLVTTAIIDFSSFIDHKEVEESLMS